MKKIVNHTRTIKEIQATTFAPPSCNNPNPNNGADVRVGINTRSRLSTSGGAAAD